MDAKAAWIVSATPQITKVHTGSGGTINPSLLSDPWDAEVSFDDIDFDESVQSVMSGGDFVLKNGKNSEPEEERPITSSRPVLDVEKFEKDMELKTLQGYTEAAKL